MKLIITDILWIKKLLVKWWTCLKKYIKLTIFGSILRIRMFLTPLHPDISGRPSCKTFAPLTLAHQPDVIFFILQMNCSSPVEAQTCHLLMYIRHVKWNVILNIHLIILPADAQLIGCVHMLCTANKRQCADLYTAHDRCGLYGRTAATAGEKIKRALRFIQVLNGVWILCHSSGYIFMGDIS